MKYSPLLPCFASFPRSKLKGTYPARAARPRAKKEKITMIYDKWRTGRSSRYMEENDAPSMVEPCYNPTIRDYLTNPTLVARHGIYDDGSEDEVSELPDNWSDEPLYAPPTPARAKKPAQGAGHKAGSKPATIVDAKEPAKEPEDDDPKEKDDGDGAGE